MAKNNPFTLKPDERAKYLERARSLLASLRERNCPDLESLYLVGRELGIGPVRHIYYGFLHFEQEPADFFPFGLSVFPKYLDQPYEVGRVKTSPEEWLAEDAYLTDKLARLGVRWLPLEDAMYRAFIREYVKPRDEGLYWPPEDYPMPLVEWPYARALFKVLLSKSESAQLRQTIKEYGQVLEIKAPSDFSTCRLVLLRISEPAMRT